MAENWSVERVGEWLKELDFAEYKDLLCAQHKIDGLALITLTEHDLKSEPLNMKVLGDIKRIKRAIDNLKEPEMDEEEARLIPNNTGKVRNLLYTKPGDETSGLALLSPLTLFGPRNRFPHLPMNKNEHKNEKEIKPIKKLRFSQLQDWIRVLVGFGYLIFAVFVSAFVMTIVHDRVPDKVKYPPLPDIFLDNVPLIPCAFQLAEICGMCLTVIIVVLLFFHKYKLIILRRLFAILGKFSTKSDLRSTLRSFISFKIALNFSQSYTMGN